MAQQDYERRATPKQHVLEARTKGNAFVLDGYASVFNRYSQPLGGFVEQVHPDAFKRTLDSDPDVRALFNHDSNYPLGRTRAQTLDLATDSEGLAYSIQLPDTSYARDLYESVQRGDVSQSSFGFFVQEDSWSETNDGMPLRTLMRVSLHNGDISPVTYPAYEDTMVGSRAVRSLAERGVNVSDFRVAVSGDGRVVTLDTTVKDLTDNTEGTAQTAPSVPLSILARRLELKRRAPVAR